MCILLLRMADFYDVSMDYLFGREESIEGQIRECAAFAASVKKRLGHCHKKSVHKQWIEDMVVKETMDMLNNDDAVEAVISMLLDLQERDNVNLPPFSSEYKIWCNIEIHRK